MTEQDKTRIGVNIEMSNIHSGMIFVGCYFHFGNT